LAGKGNEGYAMVFIILSIEESKDGMGINWHKDKRNTIPSSGLWPPVLFAIEIFTWMKKKEKG
jgi:hypothetical protein